MKCVYRGEALVDVAHVKNVLEQAGIACTIKNEYLAGGVGELPPIECQPELWVLDDAQAGRAESVIEDRLGPPAAAPPWRCAVCGESNEGQFAACWRCGSGDERS